MTKYPKNYSNAILDYIIANPSLSSKEIHDGIGIEIGYATVKKGVSILSIGATI